MLDSKLLIACAELPHPRGAVEVPDGRVALARGTSGRFTLDNLHGVLLLC